MKILEPNLSKSKILCLLDCPYRYKIENIDKVKFTQDSAPLIKGQEVHQVLDDFYKPETNKIEELVAQVKQHKDYEKHKPIIDNFIAFNQKISAKSAVGDFKPILREEKMLCYEYNVTGIVDAVFKNKSDTLVVDYKTGKVHSNKRTVFYPDGGKLVVEEIEPKYYIELSIYAHLVRSVKKIYPTHWGIFFVEHNKLLVEPIKEEEITKTKELITSCRTEIINRMQHNLWEKKKNPYCKWCMVYLNKMCEGGKDGN